jgi:hypothetical protein
MSEGGTQWKQDVFDDDDDEPEPEPTAPLTAWEGATTQVGDLILTALRHGNGLKIAVAGSVNRVPVRAESETYIVGVDKPPSYVQFPLIHKDDGTGRPVTSGAKSKITDAVIERLAQELTEPSGEAVYHVPTAEAIPFAHELPSFPVLWQRKGKRWTQATEKYGRDKAKAIFSEIQRTWGTNKPKAFFHQYVDPNDLTSEPEPYEKWDEPTPTLTEAEMMAEFTAAVKQAIASV